MLIMCMHFNFIHLIFIHSIEYEKLISQQRKFPIYSITCSDTTTASYVNLRTCSSLCALTLRTRVWIITLTHTTDLITLTHCTHRFIRNLLIQSQILLDACNSMSKDEIQRLTLSDEHSQVHSGSTSIKVNSYGPPIN